MTDFGPVLSPDKTKVAYHSHGKQTSNPEGDKEIYRINTAAGLDQKNLTDNDAFDVVIRTEARGAESATANEAPVRCEELPRPLEKAGGR